MSVKPILFNTEMVRAILSGDKTCTRRVIKPQPKSMLCYTFAGCDCGTWGYPVPSAHETWGEEYKLPDDIKKEDLKKRWKPLYQADDILYVRETWERFDCCSCEGDAQGNCPKEPSRNVIDKRGHGCYMYRATDEIYGDARWHPSIHMPKEAARIFLKVIDVRVERLQEIDIEGIRNEGLSSAAVHCGDMEIALKEWKILWNSTIKKSDLNTYGWDANPYVWVIEFERCDNPEREG